MISMIVTDITDRRPIWAGTHTKEEMMMHTITVTTVANNHGYPYRAVCECGWQSPTYCASHAAETMGAAHKEGKV